MKSITIESKARFTDDYDIIICGGGTAGCVAAIAAGRMGAKTLLLEGSGILGGMLTVGNAGLTKYVLHAKDSDEQTRVINELRENPKKVQIAGGIAVEIAEKLIADGNAVGTAGTAGSYVYTDSHEFKLLLFNMLHDAGVKLSLHSTVFDVLKEDNKITGVVYHTKEGLLYAGAKYVIDTTGDGDVANAAGVKSVVGVSPEDSTARDGLAEVGEMQVVGNMFRVGGVDFDRFIEYLKEEPEAFMEQRFSMMSYDEVMEAYEKGEMVNFIRGTKNKTGFQVYNYPRKGIMVASLNVKTPNLNGLSVDEATRAEYEVLLVAQEKIRNMRNNTPGFENAFILDVPQAGIRETRHIEGEYKLDILDIVEQREFEDTIAYSSHPIDSYPIPREVIDAEKPDRFCFSIPYRCLVAKGIDNLLVAGRQVSASHEAYGCIRPTVPCMCMGEAAGTAAALLSKTDGVKAKDIDVKLLRKTLKENGVKC